VGDEQGQALEKSLVGETRDGIIFKFRLENFKDF